jgi:endonuclease/exonuclease/phosphatase family metal-dependent hydrolase
MFHGNVSLEIARGLKVLRKRIAAARVPPSQLDKTLNLATWNIRKFGTTRRTQAAIHYIAEILGEFDVVSIVELDENLTDLERVLGILGPYWRVVYSDMIPDKGGNGERLAFVYDRRAVAFTGLASVASLPRKKNKTEYQPTFSWWRHPYLASFSAGNYDFLIATCHIQWGTAEGRLKELREFARWVRLKADHPHLEDKDIIVTGDFNVSKPAMMQALLSTGLQVPHALRKGDFGTNLAKKKRYDQILHMCRYPDSFIDKGGVIDFYTGGTGTLFPGLSKAAFTHQLSDHLPLWVQIDVDNDAFQLDQIIKSKKDT